MKSVAQTKLNQMLSVVNGEGQARWQVTSRCFDKHMRQVLRATSHTSREP